MKKRNINILVRENFCLILWLICMMTENCALPDHGGDAEIQELWSARSQRYHAMAEDQARELQELGYLKSYGAKEN